MMTSKPPEFSAPDISTTLEGLSDRALDALPFGVIEMDRDCTVLRYNATESLHSGLRPDRVVGHHFFRDVAPCSSNRFVAQRYDLEALDETIQYTFSLRLKPVPVTLRMLKSAGGDRMYLLVTW